MKFNSERIYNLLPAIHRIRDQKLVGDSGEIPPLKALFSILSEEIEHLEENIDQLYDDYFIETCSEWVIPYIGELIGSRPLIPIPDAKYSSRTEVANTIGYRRRKGTLAILEQLARDITNWDAKVVEYFKLLSTTQYMNHLRPENIVTPHLKNWEQLEYVKTPFDNIPKSAEVRNINKRRGKYNIPNIGIFLWRISSAPRERSKAFNIDGLRYTFHPLGVDTPLYNFPKNESSITQLAQVQNMPVALRRRVLKEYLELHYGAGRDIFIQIAPDHNILPGEICIGDLSDWENPSISPPEDTVVVDPVLGRLMFGNDFSGELSSNDVYVWYHYGTLNLVGGGAYFRINSFEPTDHRITVSHNSGVADFNTIQQAIDQAQSDAVNTVIEILDNETYSENLSVHLGSGMSLEIRGAQGRHPLLMLTDDFEINGDELTDLTLNGLMITGGNLLTNPAAVLEKLVLKNCTIRPAETENRIILQSAVKVEIQNSIVAGIDTVSGCVISLENSIVDVINKSAAAISGAEGERATLKIKNSTLTGEIYARSVELIENSIIISPMQIDFLQSGCVRFSYLPLNSVTPKKYNCYPENSEASSTVNPFFTSRVFGQPGYFQIHQLANTVFLEGADDGSEIGVYHDLFQPQKEANLKTRLSEYLRFGMEAGIFYTS